MTRVVLRPVELVGTVGEMRDQLPAWGIWSIASVVNALIWTGLCQTGFWLAGSSVGTAHLLALFCVVALGSFACQVLLAGRENDR